MTRLTKLALFSLMAAFVLVALDPGPSGAERLRLQRPSGRDRDGHHTMRARERAQASQVQVRLEGHFQYSPKRGLSMNGVTVLIDRATSLFSERFDEFPPARRLDGARATIFGRMTHRGVRAMLIMERTPEFMPPLIPDIYVQPSASDPRAGVYIDSAPR
jgi:hypothetical protein